MKIKCMKCKCKIFYFEPKNNGSVEARCNKCDTLLVTINQSAPAPINEQKSEILNKPEEK